MAFRGMNSPEGKVQGSSRLPVGNGKTLLIFSQVYPPDPASVGQHMADVATEMAGRGHRVTVYTSNRGYDDPTQTYPARETMAGAVIKRIPAASFGKRSFILRMVAAASFTLQVFLRGLFTPNVSGILVSTSPPLSGLAPWLLRLLRGIPYTYWVMDLNPDQLIALNSISEKSVPARFLAGINRAILRRASLVVALDQFMADRLENKANLRNRLRIIAPWPHENHLESIEHERNPFRVKHSLQDKFVLMYSGNHSASNPLRTILEAAVRLKDDPRLMFLFIGGGLGKQEIEDYVRKYDLKNVRSLPYEPLATLRYSLSAADVHIVSLGDPFVGIIHPCKVYGAMAAGRPILFLGPRPSHVSEILERHRIGWHISHGEVENAVETIRSIRHTQRSALESMGEEAHRVLQGTYSQATLCPRFCDDLEHMLHSGAFQPIASRTMPRAAHSHGRDEASDTVEVSIVGNR